MSTAHADVHGALRLPGIAPSPAAAEPDRAASETVRLPALDAVRGLIMMLMAIDHASYFIAKVHPGEFWGVPLPDYPGALPFLTRFVTHLCAPGFFFLMGVSVTLFVAARRRIGFSEGRIVRALVTRGGLLILLEHVLENPAWFLGAVGAAVPIETHGGSAPPGGGGSILFGFIVLYGLGSAMIVCAFLARLGTPAVLSVSAAAILATHLLLPGAESVAVRYSPLVRLLLVPGQTGNLLVAYPLLPWLGIAGLGLAFGRALLDDPGHAQRTALFAGSCALVLFGGLRAAGAGDFHALAGPGLIGVFNLTKYPPSLAFMLLTLGVDLLVLAAFLRAGERPVRWSGPLLVFGGSALFFYFAHLYLYALLGFAFPRGTSLAAMYPVWAAGLALLYPACAWYGRFKRRQPPESLWRLF